MPANSKFDPSVRVDQMLSSQGDGTGTIDFSNAGVTVTGSTNADPIVVTAAGHGFSDGDYVFIDGVTGNTNANGLHVVANQDTNTFELNTPAGDTVAGNGSHGGTVDAQLALVIKPAATEIYDLEDLNIVAWDGTAPTEGSFLGEAALSNGVIVAVYRDTTLVATLTPTPIKSWAMWGLAADSSEPLIDLTGGDSEQLVRWSFARGGNRIRLDGATDDFLVMYTQDDLDGLTAMYASVQGLKTVV